MLTGSWIQPNGVMMALPMRSAALPGQSVVTQALARMAGRKLQMQQTRFAQALLVPPPKLPASAVRTMPPRVTDLAWLVVLTST
jgi:hypothetical protein